MKTTILMVGLLTVNERSEKPNIIVTTLLGWIHYG
jgi:hypothetical protein